MLRPTSSHGPCLGVLNRHLGRGFIHPTNAYPCNMAGPWGLTPLRPWGGRKSLDERRVCERQRAEPVVSPHLFQMIAGAAAVAAQCSASRRHWLLGKKIASSHLFSQ